LLELHQLRSREQQGEVEELQETDLQVDSQFEELVGLSPVRLPSVLLPLRELEPAELSTVS
jgi:hypothetical protein